MGGHIGEEGAIPTTATEAEVRLSAFANAGDTHFDVTLKNELTGKVWFDRGRTVNALLTFLPALLHRAESQGLDIIIRPRGKNTHSLIQLNDLTAEGVQKVRAIAFAIIETSRGNYQAWISVTDAKETTAKTLREQTAADLNASRVMRLCGIVNHKKDYAPHFPTVCLIESHPGRTMIPPDLEANGLLLKTATTMTTPPCSFPFSFSIPHFS